MSVIIASGGIISQLFQARASLSVNVTPGPAIILCIILAGSVTGKWWGVAEGGLKVVCGGAG